MLLQPKNWAEFQHYKDRCPPWIKLHRKLLDDRAFNALPLASMALAQFLWLLASETKDGIFDGRAEEIAFRLRWKQQNVEAGLKGLISSGFFIVVQDASGALAERLHVAIPEREREAETQEERERQNIDQPRASRFGDFWDVCPKKVAKGKAQTLFERACKTTSPDLIITAMQRYAQSRAGEDSQFTKHPATWLSQKCWEDQDIPGVTILRANNAFNSPEELENQRRQYEEVYGQKTN